NSGITTTAPGQYCQQRVTRVDLDELPMGPLHRILGSHALDRLSIHVDDDVLGDDLGCVAVRRSGVANQTAGAWQIPEWTQHRVDIPHRILLPSHCGAAGIALLRGKPFLEDRFRVDPA